MLDSSKLDRPGLQRAYFKKAIRVLDYLELEMSASSSPISGILLLGSVSCNKKTVPAAQLMTRERSRHIWRRYARSSVRLHIHVPASPEVGEFLCAATKRKFTSLVFSYLGPSRAQIAAMKVETDSLAHVDPFKLLARVFRQASLPWGSQTLAVIGATLVTAGPVSIFGQRVRCVAEEIVSAEALA